MRRFTAVIILLALTLASMIVPVAAQDDCTGLNSATAYGERGSGHYNSGRYQEAITDYTCALQLEPDNTDYLNGRGISYESLNNLKAALDDYNRAIEIDPAYAAPYNNRGIVYYRMGLYSRAMDDYNRSIELEDPDFVWIPLYNRGLVYYELGDYQTAIADLTASLEVNSLYANTYITRAWAYLVIGDITPANADFAKWIELIETDSEFTEIDSSIDAATYSMTQGMVYRFAFDAVKGQEISVLAHTEGGSSLDPLVVLLDAGTLVVAADDDSGANVDAVISNFEIPYDGQYVLLLSHAAGGSEGDVTLTLDLGGDIVPSVFATFNLQVGDVAEVYTTAGDRLNLREGPGLDFEILEKLEPNDRVTLIEGPRKEDGYAWWRIRTQNGTEGWAVERVDQEQTLQGALLLNEQAVITTGGDTLNVRSGAGRDFDLIMQLEEGVTVTVIDGPQTADGFRWWQIETADGQTGWTIDRFDGDRMLVPARELESR